MSRSFQIVEYKVSETDFFLSKFQNCLEERPYLGLFMEAQSYLSAFVSASRSISFALQASLSDIDSFSEWYEEQRIKMKNNTIARYFSEARTLSQKIGYYLIGSGYPVHTDGNNTRMLYYFQHSDRLKYVPSEDVVTASKNYFCFLLEILVDCYNTFGVIIDPTRLFTYENLFSTKQGIEDFEELAEFPRGWTSVGTLTIPQRIELLRQSQPEPEIDWIFKKHLGTDRYGIPCE